MLKGEREIYKSQPLENSPYLQKRRQDDLVQTALVSCSAKACAYALPRINPVLTVVCTPMPPKVLSEALGPYRASG